MQFKRRKWGWWLVLIHRKHFKVKLLRFKRGGSISMQRHSWRNELWLFIKGRGNMESYGLKFPGDFILINKHEWHKYTAIRTTWVLEIQYGAHCNETDIERKGG